LRNSRQGQNRTHAAEVPVRSSKPVIPTQQEPVSLEVGVGGLWVAGPEMLAN
jgi:hypothetical protein